MLTVMVGNRYGMIDDDEEEWELRGEVWEEEVGKVKDD